SSAELLSDVAVHTNDAALSRQDARQHNFLAYNELPFQQRVQYFSFHIVPGKIFQHGRCAVSGDRAFQRHLLRYGKSCNFFLARSLFHEDHNPLYAPPPTIVVCPVILEARSVSSQTMVSATSA